MIDRLPQLRWVVIHVRDIAQRHGADIFQHEHASQNECQHVVKSAATAASIQRGHSNFSFSFEITWLSSLIL